MPYKKHTIEKVYWSIGNAARDLDIAVSTITFWEKKGLIKPTKFIKHSNPHSRTTRIYGPKAYQRLQLINDLRTFGITISLVKISLRKGFAEELRTYLKSRI